MLMTSSEARNWRRAASHFSVCTNSVYQPGAPDCDADMGLYTYAGNDPINWTDPTGECRNRDQEGECLVTNSAGSEGAEAAAALQVEVRLTDKAIQAIGNRDTIAVSFDGGETTVTMTGGELKSAWATTTWTVDPVGTTYANGHGGQITSRGDVSFSLDKFQEFQDIHVQWGGIANEAISTLVLHEISHNTPIGRQIGREFRRDFDQRERRTSRTGLAIGTAIGRPFQCNVFQLRC